MKRKSGKNYFSKLLVIFIVLAGVFFYFRFRTYEAKAPTIKQQQESTNTKTNSNQPATTPQTPAESPKTNVDISNLSIPILMYHHIRSYNDPNDKIGTNLSVSPDKFAAQLDLIQQDGYHTITFNDLLDGNIPAKPIILTFDDGYKNFYENAYPALKSRKMKAVSFIITGYVGGGDYMNDAEIKEIFDYGIEIGSHTVSHPDLSQLSSEKARKEITDSKSTLEAKLNKKIISFCYPSGKYNDETISLVKAAGYEFATTTKGGYAKLGSPYDLQRERVNSDTNISTYLK